MDGSMAPGTAAGGKARAFTWLLLGLHVLLGCALLSIGTALRLRGGVPFLVLGGWFAAVGIGLAAGRAWAWWSAEIGHPLFLVGEAVFLVLSFVLAKQGWKSEGMGRLGAIAMALVFLGTLAAALVTMTTWFWLRRPMVREMYFRSNPTVPGSPSLAPMTGLLAAVAMLVIGVVVVAAWGRASKLPGPPARRYARSEPRARGVPAAAAQEPCDSHFLATSVPVRFTPDGSAFVGNTSRAACVWDVATGALTATIKPERSGPIGDTAISPDGRLLAVIESQARDTGQIVLWELATGRRASAVSIPVRGAKPFLAFGPTAATLLAQTDAGTICVFDTASGAARFTWTSDGAAVIRPAVLSPSRRRIAFAAEGHGPVRIAEVDTGQIHSIDPSPVADASARTASSPRAADLVRIESMLFSRDERALYLGRFRSIAVLDLEEWKERPTLELPRGSRAGWLTPLSVSADGSRLLTEMKGFLFPVFSLPGGELVTLGAPHVSVGSEPASLFLEGRLASFAGWGRVVGVNGHVVSVALLPQENMSVGTAGNRRGPTTSWASGVSPDGSILVLDIGELSNLTIWNAATDAWVDLLSKPGSYGPMVQPVFSPDGRVLAVSGTHGIDIWNVPARKLLYRMGDRGRS